MSKAFNITLNVSTLDRLASNIPGRAATILDKIAFDVKRTAQPLTNYDTGAMRNSVYVSGASGGSEYAASASEAGSRRPGAQLLPEVKPVHKLERIVGVAVEYAYWQELQKPYLGPAVDQHRARAKTAWSKLFV